MVVQQFLKNVLVNRMNKDKKFILSFTLITILAFAVDFLIPSFSATAKANLKDLYKPAKPPIDELLYIGNVAYAANRSFEWIQIFMYKALITWRSSYFNKIRSNVLVYWILLTFITYSAYYTLIRILETLSEYGLGVDKSFQDLFGPQYNIIDFIPFILGIGMTLFSHYHGKRYSFKDIKSSRYSENKNYIYMKKSTKFIQHWRALVNGLPAGDFGFVIQGKLAKFNRGTNKLEYVPFHNSSKYCLKKIPTGKLIFEHKVSKLNKFNNNDARLCKKLGYNVKQIFRE